VLVGALCIVVGAVSPDDAQALTLTGTVSEVVDGDTIKVVARGFETPVRLIGVNTPETRDPNKPVQCFGPKASERVSRLLPVGQAVRLVTDSSQATRDRFGRLLAYVYKPGRAGAEGSINFALVRSGYAKVYVYDGVLFQHARPFFQGQAKARQARLGLWGPPCRGNVTKPDPSVARPPPEDPDPVPPTPTTPTVPTPPVPPTGSCDPNYAGACIPVYPPDVDCTQIPYRNFRVVGQDVHRFDVDHDGIACEE
jgi:micrococcal nuclease